MDSGSANRLVAIGIFFSTVVVFAFAFFQLTGGFRQIGLPGSSLRFADDVTAPVPPPPLKPDEPIVRRAPEVGSPLSEPFRPSSAAEKAYFSAVEKLEEREARIQEKRQVREQVTEFLQSERGQALTAALEMARGGKLAEAKQAFDKLIQDLTDLDTRTRVYVLKSAIQVYQQSKDTAGLKGLLARYLDILTEELSRADLAPRQKATASELLDKIEEARRQVEEGK